MLYDSRMAKETFLRSFLLFIVINFFVMPMLIILTPVRFIFEFFTVYYPDLFSKNNNPSIHLQKVNKVQQQISDWNKNGRQKLLVTSRPQWQTLSIRSLNKTKYTQIDICHLKQIIEIDAEKKIIRVEPGIKMGTLTYKLLRQGWTIPVIPEFESLTVGGCVNGTGIESSSHKYGLFADACLEFELVLADGKLMTCSKELNSDLFYAIPWSHGTIGFLTSITIQLIPASRYVKLEYYSSTSLGHTKTLLQKPGYDFVEGIMFNLNQSVVMLGRMVDDAERSKINNVNSWWKPWFFKHVEKCHESGLHVEYIPIRQYYHRHQRSYFWEASCLWPIGNWPIIRYTVGWSYPMNFQMMKFLIPESWTQTIYADSHVLQDFLLPIDKLQDIIHFAHAEVEVYPIWLCPCKLSSSVGMVHLRDKKDELYIDIGIYGDSKKYNDIHHTRKIMNFESFTIENKGYQFLYADTFLTKEDFEKMFDMSHYERMRRQFLCEDAFPHVYDKVSMKARKKLS